MARILIVDDSLIMRRNLSVILKEVGHTIVSEASNGRQAYLQYRLHKPDIVTMDITMPTMDGIDALKQIIQEDPSAKVIMISALDQKSKVYTALRNGAKHYIIKPLTAEKITTVIDSVLIEKPIEKEVIHVEELKDQPFDIKNEEGRFSITFKRELDMSDMILLLGAIQGFLYLDNLKIVFNFEKFEVHGEEGLTKFEAILNKIRSVNGEFTIKARNPNFMKRLIAKDKDLMKSFDSGNFILE